MRDPLRLHAISSGPLTHPLHEFCELEVNERGVELQIAVAVQVRQSFFFVSVDDRSGRSAVQWWKLEEIWLHAPTVADKQARPRPGGRFQLASRSHGGVVVVARVTRSTRKKNNKKDWILQERNVLAPCLSRPSPVSAPPPRVRRDRESETMGMLQIPLLSPTLLIQ